MRFFNIPTIEEDEHIYSYFLRTGMANGFSFKDLYALSNRFGRDSQISNVDYETVFGYTKLYELYNYDENDSNYESPVSLFKKLTIYNGIAPFVTQGRLKNKIMKLNKFYFDCSTIGSGQNVSHLKLCPKCMSEEIKAKGFFYYHRAHQMPEVSVCHQHNCELKQYNGALGEELTYPIDLVDIEKRQDISDDYKYAVFCKEVLDNHYQVIDGFFQIYDNLRKITNENKKHQISKTKLKRYNGTELLILCFNLFETFDCFFVNTFDNERNLSFFTLIDKINDYIVEHSDEYELFVSANKNSLKNEDARLAVIRHKVCNTRYIVRVVDFLSGRDCPYCNSLLSLEDRHIKEFESIVNRNNELLNLYVSPADSNLELYNVEQLGTFHIEKYIGTKESAGDGALIKHLPCGTVFKKSLSSFYRYPWCPVCHSRSSITCQDDFVKKIRNLVGDEYEVMDEYQTLQKKVRFMHKKCGTITSISPGNFFDGQRCAQCSRITQATDFVDFVRNISYGRYECLKIDVEYAEIKDTQTGKIKKLRRSLIIQELTRFDMKSSILPLDKRNDEISLSSPKYDILYSRICKKFRNTDIIFADELSPLNDGLVDKAGSLIRILVKKQMLFVLANKVFALSPINVTNEEIVVAKYVNRNGKQIGYLRGMSFAYKVGLLVEKPNVINIGSNLKSSKCVTSGLLCGEKVRIRSSLTEVNNDDWPIIATLDFMQSAKNKGFDYHELGPLKNWLISQNIKLEDFEDYYQYVSPWVCPKIRMIYEEN